jgi:hypothetical protein
LPDDAEVQLLGPLGEPGELQVVVHALAQRGAHERSLSKRREEKPSGKLYVAVAPRVSRRKACDHHAASRPCTASREEKGRASSSRKAVFDGLDRRIQEGERKGRESSCREAAYLNLELAWISMEAKPANKIDRTHRYITINSR